MGFTFDPPSKVGIIIPIFQVRKGSPKRLSDLPRVSEGVSGRARVLTQVSLPANLIST